MAQVAVEIPVGKLAETILICVQMDVPLVTLGPPGIGKTQIMKQVAKANGFRYCEIVLRDIGDVYMPFVAQNSGERAHLEFHYNPELPLVGSKFDDGDDSIIILNIDEWTTANKLMQNLMLKVFDERRVGEAMLLPNVRIVATGNRVEDLANVEQINAALSNRAKVVKVKLDPKAFIQHATKNNFHPMSVAWVAFDETHLYHFDKEQHLGGDYAHASPRAIERISKLLVQEERMGGMDEEIFRGLACGSIGRNQGVEFTGFRKMQSKMPNLDAVCNTGQGVIPSDPAVVFATVTALIQRADERNAHNILRYVLGLPGDFQEQVAYTIPRIKPDVQNTAAWSSFMATVSNAAEELRKRAEDPGEETDLASYAQKAKAALGKTKLF